MAQDHLAGPISMERCLRILNISQEAYPAIILLVFVLGFILYGVQNAPPEDSKVEIHAMKGPGGRPLPQRRKSANQVKDSLKVQDFSLRGKILFRILQTGILASFLVNAATLILQSLIKRKDEWWAGQSAVTYVAGSFFTWAIVLISLVDSKPSPTWVHLVTWFVALPLDLLIMGTSIQIYTVPHHEPRIGNQQGGKYHENITAWEVVDVIVYLVRSALLLGVLVLYLIFQIGAMRQSRSKANGSDEERPLLQQQNVGQSQNGHAYRGTQANGHAEAKTSPQPEPWAKPTETPNITWYSYLKGFVVLVPYLWPRKSRKLQALALTCFLLMSAQRIINVFVPVMTGRITDALSGENGKAVRAPWLEIALYILFRWLQGGQGILGALRSVLWIPVEQYSYRAISTAAFEHVHNLSADFHTGKRTGELISALNKGSSINSFLEMVTFSVGPMIFDLVVAVVYLTITFDVYLGLVVAITTFLYIYITIRMASWRVALRRQYVNADREMEAIKNDSLHAWDTVKYFNAEEYEFDRYRSSIKIMQAFERWVQITLAYMNTAQGALFMFALLIASFIEAFQVAQGYQTVGRFVVLLTYMAQLQAPLNFFGTFYRAIQSNLINAERMLELFKEQPKVVDKPTAEKIDNCEGEIIFDDVTFSYDDQKQALQHLSFVCKPGTTTALVGESGGGKSSILRLLFRYYNPQSGRIRIDGKDVQDITIDSLRRQIGVVPQDCGMFNESIMYNLKYANQDATEEEIYDACRAASIHERILGFTDKYNTKVGEQGVRLSGGERQRVAIARTILKNPRITLLDEATAALDTETEERIQQAFSSLGEGRTMLIIAHRLSTITNADQILVLSGGTVVESGTHDELIAKGGKYASMWRKQSRQQQAEAEAEELRSRARKRLETAEADSASVSEDEVDRIRGNSRPGSPSVGRGHKRVNFSQSSLAREWHGDGGRSSQQTGTGDGGSKWSGGRPAGHP